jgi:hypothetical protein
VTEGLKTKLDFGLLPDYLVMKLTVKVIVLMLTYYLLILLDNLKPSECFELIVLFELPD